MLRQRLVRAQVLLASCSFVCAVLFQSNAFITERSGPDYAVYRPHPYFLVTFFAVQMVLQLWWIIQVFHTDPRESGPPLLSTEDDEELRVGPRNVVHHAGPEPTQMAYFPLYTLGNIFIVGWTIAWDFEHFATAQVLVSLNTAVQLYFVLGILHSAGKYTWSRKNRLTHLVAKTSAASAVLYTWRTWGAVTIGVTSHPSIQQQVHCGVIFLLLVLASGPDPTLGICLLFDLTALGAGNTHGEWQSAFWFIGGVIAVVIVGDVAIVMWKERHSLDNRNFSPLRSDDSHETEEIWMSDLPEDGGRV